jgi:hypothetical protein
MLQSIAIAYFFCAIVPAFIWSRGGNPNVSFGSVLAVVTFFEAATVALVLGGVLLLSNMR